jgi:hypothetical protein
MTLFTGGSCPPRELKAMVGPKIFILVGGNGPVLHGPPASITGRDSHGEF